MHPRIMRVLVLGEAASAASIVQQLQSQGYEAVSQKAYGMRSVSLMDENLLKALFFQFKKDLDSSDLHLMVHPGVSRWSQRPDLFTLAQLFEMDVISCSSRILALFSNLFSLLGEAKKIRIPTLVEDLEVLCSVREVRAFYEKKGHSFPFVLKSIYGTGNAGLFIVTEEKSLKQDLPLWMERLQATHGDVVLIAERYLYDSRCVVVPFVRFLDGTMYFFPMVDATLQHRFRKIIQFCPDQYLSSQRKDDLKQFCKQLAEQIDFVGVGSFEFLVDANSSFFIGGLARLNTQFELWETISQTQAVSWQLASLGFPLKSYPLMNIQSNVLGGSFRILAEDSSFFIPHMGVVREILTEQAWKEGDLQASLHLAVEPGEQLVDTDSGTLGYLNIIAPNWSKLLHFAQHIFPQIMIAGSIQTNHGFLLQAIQHPWLKEGMYCCGFFDEEFCADPLENDLLEAAVVLAHFLDPALALAVVGFQKKILYKNLNVSKFQVFFEERKSFECKGKIKIADLPMLRFFVYKAVNQRCFYVHLGVYSFNVRKCELLEKNTNQELTLSALMSGRISGPYFMDGNVIDPGNLLYVISTFGYFIAHRLPMRLKLVRAYKASQSLVEQADILAEFTKENIHGSFSEKN